MSCDEIAAEAKNLRKTYEVYARPVDRLLQTLCCGRKKFYREFRALDDVSFQIRKGSCTGIIGRNGAGKSTLLQMLAGTLAASSGSLEIHGRAAALLELGTGFDPEFTGLENIRMNASLLGLSEDEIEKKMESIIAFADIGDAIQQPVKTYSSGMAMRLAFAVIANIEADILLIDEALAVGDVVFIQKCMRFLHEFMRTHTVILVTHDTGAVLNLCDTVLWIEQGKIRESGEPKKIVDDYLEFCYKIQQGDGKKGILPPELPAKKTAGAVRDIRRELMNSSNLMHTYEIFEFNPDAPSFGKGGAKIISIDFRDESGRRLVSTAGDETVELRIRCECLEDMFSPIIGFAFRNYLGVNLFGDNTFIAYRDRPLSVRAGDVVEAKFVFQMPRLQPGDYTMHAAIAAGTQSRHVQQQWFHDALRLRSSFAGEQGVLVGIPMTSVELTLQEKS